MLVGALAEIFFGRVANRLTCMIYCRSSDGMLIRRTQQTHSGRAPSGKIKDPARLSLMKSLATGEFVVSDLFKQRVVHGLDDPNESDQEPCCCEMSG